MKTELKGYKKIFVHNKENIPHHTNIPFAFMLSVSLYLIFFSVVLLGLPTKDL